MNNKEKVVKVLSKETEMIPLDELATKAKISEKGAKAVCEMLYSWRVIRVFYAEEQTMCGVLVDTANPSCTAIERITPHEIQL